MVFFAAPFSNASIHEIECLGGCLEVEAGQGMFEIRFTDRAFEDLEVFPRSEQRRILAGLESHLTSDAAHETDDRKRLHPDGLAEWEIRLGNIRVFYDVDIKTRTVKIEAVGKSFLR